MFNPAKLMGVTSLDVVRAKTFVAEKQGEPGDIPLTTLEFSLRAVVVEPPSGLAFFARCGDGGCYACA